MEGSRNSRTFCEPYVPGAGSHLQRRSKCFPNTPSLRHYGQNRPARPHLRFADPPSTDLPDIVRVADDTPGDNGTTSTPWSFVVKLASVRCLLPLLNSSRPGRSDHVRHCLGSVENISTWPAYQPSGSLNTPTGGRTGSAHRPVQLRGGATRDGDWIPSIRGGFFCRLVTSLLHDSPPEVCPDLSAHLARVIRPCLEEEPRYRMQMARNVRERVPRHGAPCLRSSPVAGSTIRAVSRPDSGGAPAAEWPLARAPRISSEVAGLAACSSTANSAPQVNPTKEGWSDRAITCENFFNRNDQIRRQFALT